MKNNRGFTLIEIIIAVTILGGLIAVTLSRLNISNQISNIVTTSLSTAISEISSSYGNYVNDKNISPTGLTDSTFVPTYLMIPKVPTGFDSTYGTNGFNMAQQTGQAAPNNGWYIATKVAISGPNDIKYVGITQLAAQYPNTQFYYNTTAPPATTNMAAPAAAATVYTTYWISRY